MKLLTSFNYSYFAPAYFVGKFFSFLQKNGVMIISKRKNHNDAEKLTETYSIAVHHIMLADRFRVGAYRNAINQVSSGKRVLDIGSGPFSLLAQMALKAGAKQATAVEAGEKSYQAALVHINPERVDRLILEKCYSTDKPEPKEDEKYDLLIHEIIGCIGSDEGALPVVKDAKERLLKKGASIIPHSFSTYLVPVSPVTQITLFESFISKIYMENESFFNTKLNTIGIYDIFNFPTEHALSEPQLFEKFEFNTDFNSTQKNVQTFVINPHNSEQSVLFDGFALFLELTVDAENIVNSFTQKTSWNVIYIKLLETPREIKVGEKIQVECEIDAINVDTKYAITVTMQNGEKLLYSWNGSNPKVIGKI